MNDPHDADVALLTDRRYTADTAAPDDWYLSNILRDDGHLMQELAIRGLRAVRLDWSRTDIEWNRFRAVVFRTTWDYFDRFSEFSAFLNRWGTTARFCNPIQTIRWNMDKHYLADLASQGVSVIPTRYIERGSAVSLREIITDAGWDECVVKPCVSGAARHTHRVSRSSAAAVDAVIRPLIEQESFLIQPFQEDIVRTGEDTLMVFGGSVTHAVRKVAKTGDFRVQDDFGGKVHAYTPSQDQVDTALQAIACVEPMPVYGRVDLVRGGDGRPAVMELELIEPELWIRMEPSSAARFADGICRSCRA